jgi:hypothetical protein
MRLSATLPAQCWWYARTRAPRILSGLSSLQEVDNDLNRDQLQIFVAWLVCTRGRYFGVEGGGSVHLFRPARLDGDPILCDLDDLLNRYQVALLPYPQKPPAPTSRKRTSRSLRSM